MQVGTSPHPRFPSNAASQKAQPRQRSKQSAAAQGGPQCPYDELVLHWCMTAHDTLPSERADALERAAANRKACLSIGCLSPFESSSETAEALHQEMERCAAHLRGDGDTLAKRAEAFRSLDSTCTIAPMLMRECKLELCFGNESESIFDAKAVTAELNRQQVSLLENKYQVIASSVWRPPSSGAESRTFCIYVGLSKSDSGELVARRYDTVSFDTEGYVRLIVRTLLTKRSEDGEVGVCGDLAFGSLINGVVR